MGAPTVTKIINYQQPLFQFNYLDVGLWEKFGQLVKDAQNLLLIAETMPLKIHQIILISQLFLCAASLASLILISALLLGNR